MPLERRQCRGCGAPLPEHSHTCAYCGSSHMPSGDVVVLPRAQLVSNANNVRVIRTLSTTDCDSYTWKPYNGGHIRRYGAR